MSRFLAPQYQNIVPYTPGLQPQGRAYIKLNTNESPYAPSPKAVQAAAEAARNLQLYPDPSATYLTKALADTLGVQAENLILGNGSDEILAYCFMALCSRGAAFADITYSFYPVWARLYNVPVKLVPLRDDFSIVVEDYADVASTVFIANPNAPTALALGLDEIERLLQQNRDRLVVVDEAYIDFGGQSATPLLQRYDNLVVTGTFSKSRQMAGARLGWAAASAEIIADLERIHHSFNSYTVNRMTQAAGLATLQDVDYFEMCRQKVMQTRQRALQEIKKLGFITTESTANFVFCRHKTISGTELYQMLYEAGILIRRWDIPRIQGWLRITVGTDDEMDTLIKVLQAIINT